MPRKEKGADMTEPSKLDETGGKGGTFKGGVPKAGKRLTRKLDQESPTPATGAQTPKVGLKKNRENGKGSGNR